MNLASWTYRNVRSSRNGPIDKIEAGKSVDNWWASATLNPELRKHSQSFRLYANVDGSGSSQSKGEAIYIAISEALERWAYYANFNSNRYGFDIDYTSSGMAAFPSITPYEARKRSQFEAIERWALSSWWAGKLKSRLIPSNSDRINLLEILTPFSKTKTVLIYIVGNNSPSVYGFATRSSYSSAIKHALVELRRNKISLSKVGKKKVDDVLESRLVYFASKSGTEHFLEQVRRSLKLNRSLRIPRVVADSPIKGAWSKYTHVWRTLYEPVNTDHLTDRKDVFFF